MSGKTVTEKILEQHLVSGKLTAGEEISIRIDQTLTQDATGTMAYLQFEALDCERVKTELSVSYVDHNTLQMGFENADDHRYLKSVAAKFGVVFSRPGNGVCHQVHLEEFGRPGRTLIGSDSHTPTGGGIGMFSFGAGGLDVAAAMAGAPIYLSAPEVIGIRLEGKLSPWATAKDVILKVLSIFTSKGNVGRVFEYVGPGVKTLEVPERATITNMGAECGVTTSLFPSDEITRRFMAAQSREEAWVELQADENAVYSKEQVIDLADLEPLAACPHSPDNIKTVAELNGTVINQVCIGSCTNSSYTDLTAAAAILKGRTVYPDISLVVSPGSRQVLSMITENGALADLVEAGARIVEPCCGFCIGAGQSPPSAGVSLRTNNRNFKGRSGTADAGIYLVSPQTAAVSAIFGRITDPCSTDMTPPQIEIPQTFHKSETMIILPPEDGSDTAIVRGPNIGPPPARERMPEDLSCTVELKVGDKITTDHIMPAGNRLKYRSNIETYSGFVFEPVDSQFPARARANLEKGVFTAIVAGLSYGQGSSREHAAMCPMYLGVRALIAKSIERIHLANLVNFGILPLVFSDPTDYDRIEPGQEIRIPDLNKSLNSERVMVSVGERGIEAAVPVSVRQRDIILAGGLLNFIKETENA